MTLKITQNNSFQTQVLILNGAAESGKGTLIDYVEELFAVHTYVYSSIKYVKEVAIRQFGWDGEKDPKGRNLLSGIKQLMINYNNLPTLKVIERLNEAIAGKNDLFIVDIREPDEIEKLVNHCKTVNIECITCRIHNKKKEEEAKQNGLSLTGDRLYGKYDYDWAIDNNGSLSLFKNRIKIAFSDILGRN